MGMWRRVNDRDIPNERHWSAHTSTTSRNARADLVPCTPLPAETGPVWAPNRLSVWPVEGGRFGIDAHYHGLTGIERAHVQQTRLESWASLRPSSMTPMVASSASDLSRTLRPGSRWRPSSAALSDGLTYSPWVAGIIGAGRSWTACTISVLSIPRKYTDVIARSA
jgi:hypothetical protein